MKNPYLFLVVVCTVFATQAQEYFESLPENPGPNVCFAKCVVPDEYREEVVRVMTKPEYTVLEVIPAVYETKTEEIIVKPASIEYSNVPAVYRTVYDTVWTVDSYNKLSVIPASFSDDFESVEIKPKTGAWVAGEKDPDCPSIDPADCRIFHYVENETVTRDLPKKLMENTDSLNVKLR